MDNMDMRIIHSIYSYPDLIFIRIMDIEFYHGYISMDRRNTRIQNSILKIKFVTLNSYSPNF